ncbi:MAG: hypothetical protein ACYC6Y_16385 [Thermoguttaceae bacterium]
MKYRVLPALFLVLAIGCTAPAAEGKKGLLSQDKTRLGCYGGSAGAGTSLWLAFHDDLADPGSADPVLRESSRLTCAGANACQFSYDILQWEELFGTEAREFQRGDDLPGMYGLKTDAELLEPAGRKIRADCDMRGLISSDDPPVYVDTDRPGGELTDRGHLLHHPKHAMAIRARCREAGVEVVASIPAFGVKPADGEPPTLAKFLLEHLQAAPAQGG